MKLKTRINGENKNNKSNQNINANSKFENSALISGGSNNSSVTITEDRRTPRQVLLDPQILRFSKSFIGYYKEVKGKPYTICDIYNEKEKQEPMDVVLMEDGKFTTLGNSRLCIYRSRGELVPSYLRHYTDIIKSGSKKTWGAEVKDKIKGDPDHDFRHEYPDGMLSAPNIIYSYIEFPYPCDHPKLQELCLENNTISFKKEGHI
eukprot:gene5199-6475_t